MGDMSIGRAVSWHAQQAPDEVALVRDGVTSTRRELDLVTNRVAHELLRDGAVVDDVVALDLSDPLDLVLASVGVWKAGCTPLPLRLAGRERDDVLALARPRTVVSTLRLASDDTPLPDLAASSWRLTASSGSTGPPKLVRATAPARVDPARASTSWLPRRAVQLVGGPLAHAASYTYALRGLMTGHRLVLMRRFDPGEWLRLVEEQAVTWAALNPTAMARIWESPSRTETDVGELEGVVHLGARCPEALKRDWIGWLGPERVTEVYAGSESQGVAVIGGHDWLQHPGAVGRATGGPGGSEFRVVRPDGSDCAADEPGEIVMRRATSASSYVGGGATRDDGWHSLGDAGWIDADGWLHVGDRLDDLLPTRSGWVAPADVETVVEAHPGVRSCVVVAAPDGPHGSDGPVAVVEAHPGARVGPADLEVWAAARLPAERRPAAYVLVEEPLRDDAGKTSRARWRRRLSSARGGSGGSGRSADGS